jgi:hypothetical protein
MCVTLTNVIALADIIKAAVYPNRGITRAYCIFLKK